MSEKIMDIGGISVCGGCTHLLQGACSVCVNKAIAAAEERGRRAGIEEAALAPDEAVKRLTAAMREADRLFEQVGGSTRHHVRDCLLPVLEKHGLRLVAALAPRDSGKEG